MNILVLLHSTTGNTRLVTRYAVKKLEAMGHECLLHDVVRGRVLPDPRDYDLLGVACPTMYFRPTFVMERAVARLPNAVGRVPAFLLATCIGEPGAHFSILAELLGNKGYAVLDGHFVMAPSNWPPHLALIREPMASTTSMGRALCKASRPLRPLWGSIWPESFAADEGDRAALVRFLERVLHAAEQEGPARAPAPRALHKATPGTAASGRLTHREMMDEIVSIGIDERLCSKCGTCVKVCPAQVITQSSEEALPTVGRGCTGCWSCYNHCPDGAVSGNGARPGAGRYKGPPLEMRQVFRR